MRVRPSILAPFVALALVGCPPATRTRLGTEHEATREVSASGPSVMSYAGAAPSEGAAVAGGGDLEGVARGVSAAAAARGVALTADPRLATLSLQLADHLGPGGEPPDAELIDFLGWHLGLTDPTPHLIVLGLPDRASAPEAVEASVRRFLERQRYTHWGAAVVPRNGLWLVVVSLSWRWATLEPLARHVDVGTPIPVRGALAPEHTNPVLLVEHPDGDVERLPAGSGPSFDVRVPTPIAGRYRVEVLARGPLGETVAANVPIYVGVDVPTTIRLGERASTAGATDVASVHAELVRLVNETRAERALPPLRCDPRVDGVAQAHTEDMAQHDFLGHQSPTTGTAADRVRAAGLASGLVLENIGRGYTAAEIHRGLLASPGHRANVLNEDANVCGLGVVAQDDEGRTAFIATELFLRFIDPIDVAAAPAAVLEAVNRARTARGAAPLEAEENLSAAASEAAGAFFAEPTLSQTDTVERASTSLRRFSMLFRRVGGVIAVVGALDEASTLEPTLDDGVRYVGVGVAQGTREDTGPNAIAVVLMLGWAR